MPTLTITTTAGQASRIAAAVGAEVGLRDASGRQRDATNAEVKDWVIAKTRRLVHDHETRVALSAVVAPAAFDPT